MAFSSSCRQAIVVKLLSKVQQVQICVKQIKQELYGEFLNSPARDSEGREKIYLMGKMFDLLLVNIKSVMETGKLNKKQ